MPIESYNQRFEENLTAPSLKVCEQGIESYL